MSDYWSERLAEKTFESNSEEMIKELTQIYKEESQQVQNLVTDLYVKMLEDGEISTTNLYKYSRFTSLSNEINKVLKSYGEEEVELITGGLESAYKEVFGATSEELGNEVVWGIQNTKVMEEVVNANFKGADFSSRIWSHQDDLVTVLEKNIKDTVANGKSKDELVSVLKNTFNSSFSNADRLARTETMRVINEGQKNSFVDNGYTKGYYVYSDDDRCCEYCEEIAKQTREEPVDLESMEAVHHPNCRCTIRPVVEMKSLMENGRDTGEIPSREDFDYDAAKGMEMSLNKDNEDDIINMSANESVQHTEFSGHSPAPLEYEPNAILDHIGKDGIVETRSYYNELGKKSIDITNHNHGNSKIHPFGTNGEHAHEYEYNEDGVLIDRSIRELTDEEREENGDML